MLGRAFICGSDVSQAQMDTLAHTELLAEELPAEQAEWLSRATEAVGPLWRRLLRDGRALLRSPVNKSQRKPLAVHIHSSVGPTTPRSQAACSSVSSNLGNN